MNQFRVIFLGERRISQRAIELLCSELFRQWFDIRVIVSNPQFLEDARRKLFLDKEPKLISNSARNTEEILTAIKSEQVNLLLSVQHIWILSSEILGAVNGVAFNLHNSALPDYKGYNSISHAIIGGSDIYRTTIHWMDPEVDRGDIAFEGLVPIGKDETALSLYRKTVDVAVEQFEALLFALTKACVPRVPMNAGGKFFKRSDLDALKDVSQVKSVQELDRVVRGAFFPPFEPAYRMEGGVKQYLLPASGWAELITTMRSENQPTWD